MTIPLKAEFTLNKHGGGYSDVSSREHDRQHFHVFVVDGDLFVLLQSESVIFTDPDGDGFGARRGVGHQTRGKPHTLANNVKIIPTAV